METFYNTPEYRTYQAASAKCTAAFAPEHYDGETIEINGRKYELRHAPAFNRNRPVKWIYVPTEELFGTEQDYQCRSYRTAEDAIAAAEKDAGLRVDDRKRCRCGAIAEMTFSTRPVCADHA